jgi:hypothetical protein
MTIWPRSSCSITTARADTSRPPALRDQFQDHLPVRLAAEHLGDLQSGVEGGDGALQLDVPGVET